MDNVLFRHQSTCSFRQFTINTINTIILMCCPNLVNLLEKYIWFVFPAMGDGHTIYIYITVGLLFGFTFTYLVLKLYLTFIVCGQ